MLALSRGHTVASEVCLRCTHYQLITRIRMLINILQLLDSHFAWHPQTQIYCSEDKELISNILDQKSLRVSGLILGDSWEGLRMLVEGAAAYNPGHLPMTQTTSLPFP